MKAKTILSEIYCSISDSYCKNIDCDKDYTFYKYVIQQLTHFKEKIKQIPETEILQLIQPSLSFDLFKGTKSKNRFNNFISVLVDEHVKILELYYKGNIWKAKELLEDLLLSKKKLNRYLGDLYINSLKYDLIPSATYYRMRDCKKNETPSDCWHIPFELRYLAPSGRFAINGFPCLYLSDSAETANKELGVVKKGYVRWFSRFTLKNPLSKKQIFLIDLRIPNKKQIVSSELHEILDLIITYPIRLLCCSKAIKSHATAEEYFFSQLFINLLLADDTILPSFKGFIYNSTVKEGGINYAIPATYNGLKPIKGHSPFLLSLFNATTPKRYINK